MIAQEASCKPAGATAELEYGLRRREVSVADELVGGAILVEGLRILQLSDSIVDPPRFTIRKCPHPGKIARSSSLGRSPPNHMSSLEVDLPLRERK